MPQSARAKWQRACFLATNCICCVPLSMTSSDAAPERSLQTTAAVDHSWAAQTLKLLPVLPPTLLQHPDHQVTPMTRAHASALAVIHASMAWA